MNRAVVPRPEIMLRQGRYRAFIHTYKLLARRPPIEADLIRHFRAVPSGVHQMVLTLEKAV